LPESLVVEQAADILEHVSTDELVIRIAEMRDRLNDYRTKYGVDSPEEVTIEQTNRTLSETDSGQSDIDAATLQDWQTTRRNLAFAKAHVDQLRGTDLDWTVVRAPRLTDGTGAGEYRAGEIALGFESIARADVARFMLDTIETDGYVREMPKVGPA